MRYVTDAAVADEPVQPGLANGATLLVLGGTAFQLPAILHAIRMGCTVVSCDYLPHNPGHRYAHYFANASTTDADAVLAVARKYCVDGILAYASDPAATTAATVASQLNLPGSPSTAIQTLSNKVLFRTFQHEQHFRAPRFVAATSVASAQEAARQIGFPAMIKPADSSGSKGVTKVLSIDDVAAAASRAMRYSRCATIIVEEWIERLGMQIAGDGLVVGGRLVFDGFGDEHFDVSCSPHAPIGESLPGQLPSQFREPLLNELQRLFSLLDVQELVFNVDAIIDRDGQPLLLEVGPRAGGNALPQLIHHATGVDMTDIAIRQALGINVPTALYQVRHAKYTASHILHSRVSGRFCGFTLSTALHPHVIDVTLTARLGDKVSPFESSQDALGYALFDFPDAAIMREKIAIMSDSFIPIVE